MASPRDYWVLGIAAAVRDRAARLVARFALHHDPAPPRGDSAPQPRRASCPNPSPNAAKTTALLRMGPPVADADALPLPLIARYLDRYGIRADKIRVTSRDNASDASKRGDLDRRHGVGGRQPGGAAGAIPADPAAQRPRWPPAGWPTTSVRSDGKPAASRPTTSRGCWRPTRAKLAGSPRSASDYVAAYRVRVDDGLPETLEAIRTHPARETCTALEIAGGWEPTPPSRPRVRF